MIELIIPAINEGLNFKVKKFGLCQIIQDTFDETVVQYPVQYCDGENLQPFNHAAIGVLYHRITGPISDSDVTDAPFGSNGCDTAVTRVYPLRVVIIAKKTLFTGYEETQLATTLMDSLTDSNKSITGITAEVIAINATSSDSNRYTIWNEETAGLPMEINFEYTLARVDYTVSVTGDISCFNNLCS